MKINRLIALEKKIAPAPVTKTRVLIVRPGGDFEEFTGGPQGGRIIPRAEYEREKAEHPEIEYIHMEYKPSDKRRYA